MCVCLSVSVCVSVSMCVCVWECVSMNVCVCVCVWAGVSMCVSVCVCVSVCLWVYVIMYVCVSVYMCVRGYHNWTLKTKCRQLLGFYIRYQLLQMIQSSLPRTVSASSEHLVVKKGASVDTSQRNIPDRWSGIFFRDTWFAFDDDICEINKQIGWICQIGNTAISSLTKFILQYFSRPTCHTCSFLTPDISLSIYTPSCLF